jgi:hypothetical protein
VYFHRSSVSCTRHGSGGAGRSLRFGVPEWDIESRLWCCRAVILDLVLSSSGFTWLGMSGGSDAERVGGRSAAEGEVGAPYLQGP